MNKVTITVPLETLKNISIRLGYSSLKEFREEYGIQQIEDEEILDKFAEAFLAYFLEKVKET